MIRYLYGDELSAFPKLAAGMFRDRAVQFADRLGWAVEVDGNGQERDAYDRLNPLYVILERADGTHGGSMRFLPTVGSTMVNDHFSHLTDGVRIESPFVWEVTRFCLAPGADARASAMLMLGGAELGRAFHLDHAVGVFDARMVRVYGRLGWEPDVLGTDGDGREAISVGLWAFEEASRRRLLAKAGVPEDLSRHWIDQAFGHPAPLAKAG